MNLKNNILQDKLQRHQMPIDDSFWAEMQARLQKEKRRKIIPLWWASGIAAAVAVFLLLAIPKSEQNVEIADSQEFSINNQNKQNSSSIPQFPEKQEIKNQIQKENNVFNISKKIEKNNFNKNITENIADSQQVNKSISDIPKLINEKDEIAEQVRNDKTENNNNFSELRPKKTLADYEKTDTKNFEKHKSDKRNFALALNMAYGSSTSDFTDGKTSTPARGPAKKGTSSGLDNYLASKSLEELLAEYPQTTYLPPLSVGLTVRKHLTDNFSLETGLIYTYLKTKFNNENPWTKQTATLQLHYLGVPLNAVYTLIDNRKWTLYASAGGTVEKGLWLDYEKITTYEYMQDGDFERQHLQDKVGRVQLSANTAIGAAVYLARNFSVYLEPRIGYYFKNQQPVSIRTDSPLHLELSAGMRVMISD